MTDELDRVKTALADRYVIQRELGSGGMATVYLARDLKHERDVAVKVLRAELAAAVGSDRFLREIRVTARLNHPHILPLLDSGEADGLLYYVMPCVPGGSLRCCLHRDSRVPLDFALRITQHVAAALEHAHRHGVIHRDVKPENILLSEGHAVVADFGIAKAVSTAGREALTRSGFPLGTPGYMSPEQAMGIADLDAKTDVYSLACVVYEMLIGETPAVWPTEEALRLGRLIDAPPEQRQRLDGLPGRVEQVLTRALALRPVDRYATPVEFAEALAAATEGRVKLTEVRVREIIGRAAALQAEHPTEEGALSIGAVEQIAAEVGIPPEHVRQAVKELEQRSVPGPVQQAMRAPRLIEVRRDALTIERTIEGEVPESAYEAMVEEIQATLSMVGHASTLGKTLTWSPAAAGTEGRRVVVTITREAGQTRIHIEERLELTGWLKIAPGWGAGASGLLGALLGIWLVGEGPQTALVALIFAVCGGVLTARLLISSAAERRRPELERLADRLAAHVQQAAERSG
jgi:hypothetical protein